MTRLHAKHTRLFGAAAVEGFPDECLTGGQARQGADFPLESASSDMITNSHAPLSWMQLFLPKFWVWQEQILLSGTWHRIEQNSLALPDASGNSGRGAGVKVV